MSLQKHIPSIMRRQYLVADHSFEELLAPNLYFDNEHDIEATRIMPGEYYVTLRSMLLVTVMCSCVCLHT